VDGQHLDQEDTMSQIISITTATPGTRAHWRDGEEWNEIAAWALLDTGHVVGLFVVDGDNGGQLARVDDHAAEFVCYETATMREDERERLGR
jgi:hypothetical protein